MCRGNLLFLHGYFPYSAVGVGTIVPSQQNGPKSTKKTPNAPEISVFSLYILKTFLLLLLRLYYWMESYLFPMHLFSTPWKHWGVEKGWIGNKWVKRSMWICLFLLLFLMVPFSFDFRIYGFYDECKRRYNIKLWKTFTDCFNCLPLGKFLLTVPCQSLFKGMPFSVTIIFKILFHLRGST